MAVECTNDGFVYMDGGLLTVDLRQRPGDGCYIHSYAFTPAEGAKGKLIRMKDAAERYNVSTATLSHWVDRELVTSVVRGPRHTVIEESSLAVVAGLFNYVKFKCNCSPRKAFSIVNEVIDQPAPEYDDVYLIDFNPVADPELVGRSIRLSEAAEKYGVNTSTLSKWAQKGIVTVIEKQEKYVTSDEWSVARAAKIYNEILKYRSPREAAWILKRASRLWHQEDK